MMKNYISILVLAFTCAISINTLTAQEKKVSKKVIVIEKVVDEDGNVTEKKIVKEGSEADAYIKEMDIDVEIESAEKEPMKLEKKKAFKIKRVDDEGNEKVFEWNGEGEMPEELKNALEEEGISIDDEDENIWVTDEGTKIDLGDGEKKVIKKEAFKMKFMDEDGNVEVFEWDGEGEMPEEMKKMKEEHEIHEEHKVIKVDVDASDKASKIIIKKSKNGEEEEYEIELEGDDLPDDVKKMLEEENIKVFVEDYEEEENSNKAQLGVMIEEVSSGVKIVDIVENTAAADAGLSKGQVIKAVDGIKVKTPKELVNLISAYKPGDKVKLSIDNGGADEDVIVILKERIDNFPVKSWDSFMIDEDKNDKEDIKIIIKKEK